MPVILSDHTYQRLMKMLEKWEKGDIIQPGKNLLTEETGTGYQKLGANVPLSSGGSGSGTSLNVSDGTNTISGVSRMNFIGTLFSVTSGGANIANINLYTTNCT